MTNKELKTLKVGDIVSNVVNVPCATGGYVGAGWDYKVIKKTNIGYKIQIIRCGNSDTIIENGNVFDLTEYNVVACDNLYIKQRA